MQIYTLTSLTSTASRERRVMIQGFDIPWRVLVVLVPASIPALLILAVLWPWLNAYALVPAGALVAGIWWAVEARTNRGLHVRQYQAWWDRRSEPNGRLVMCGFVIQPPVLTHIRSSSSPVVRSSDPFIPGTTGRQVSQSGQSWF